MHTFSVEEYDHIPPHLQHEAEVERKEAFHEDAALDTPLKRQTNEDRFCSERDRIKYLFASENGHLVGSLILFARVAIFDNQPFTLGGVGEVWTKKEYENQGIATTLLKRGMNILKQHACDVAFLCTDVEKPARLHLYGKVGFVPLHKIYMYQGKSGKHYEDDDGMIAPVNSPELYAHILRSNVPLDLGTGNW